MPSVPRDAFYDPAHGLIFEVILELITRGNGAAISAQIDFIQLKQALIDRHQLEDVGGAQFLNDLYSFVTTAESAAYHAEAILEYYGRRRLILGCKRLESLAADRTVSAGELLGKAEAELVEAGASFGGASSTSQELSVGDLINFDREKDPNSVMGKRWLSRGDSLLISGPTGIGKSSFAMQAVITWALGGKLFGIHTGNKQRVLVIQSENNLGDLAIGFQDCCDLLEVSRTTLSELEKSLIFVRQSTLTGEAFVHELRRLLNRHQAHIVLIDPLFSYLGGDASSQEVMSKFLRNQIQPVLDQTGAILVVIHHTAKPPKDSEKTPAEGFAHRSFGSVELLNWAREIMTFVPRDWERRMFSIEFRKRARQAGIVNAEGSPTYELFVKHSARGVVWETCSSEEIESLTEKTSKRGRPATGQADVALAVLRGAEASGGLTFERWMEATKLPEASFKRVRKQLLETKRIFKSVDGTYQIHPNHLRNGTNI
jgi:AAA domain/DnaB-like helicase N terminal domain